VTTRIRGNNAEKFAGTCISSLELCEVALGTVVAVLDANDNRGGGSGGIEGAGGNELGEEHPERR